MLCSHSVITNIRHLKSSIQHFVFSCSSCQEHTHAVVRVRSTFRHHACFPAKPRKEISASPSRKRGFHKGVACSASSIENARHRVVFLGTPEVRWYKGLWSYLKAVVLYNSNGKETAVTPISIQVASSVLQQLLKAADEPEATFEVKLPLKQCHIQSTSLHISHYDDSKVL